MPRTRRRSVWLLAGVFVLALGIGFWLGGGGPAEDQRESGLADFPSREAPVGSVASWTQASEGEERPRPVSVEEISEEDRLIAEFPMDLDQIPPNIMDDIRRIAEAENPEGVPPHILEELEREMGLMGSASSQVGRMAVQTMVDTALAFERMSRENVQPVRPTNDELTEMREEARARVPTPGQWELMGVPRAEPAP